MWQIKSFQNNLKYKIVYEVKLVQEKQNNDYKLKDSSLQWQLQFRLTLE